MLSGKPKNLRKLPILNFGSLKGTGLHLAKLFLFHEKKLRKTLGSKSLQDKLDTIMVMPERSREKLLKRVNKILGIRPLRKVQ